jgi:hypothetical protein
MAMVKVYYGRGYDIKSDQVLETRRPARKDVISAFKLQLLENRVYEVDESALDEYGFVRRELMGALNEESAPG